MCELLKRALVGRSHEGFSCRRKEEAYIKHKRYKNNIATKNYSDSIWIHPPLQQWCIHFDEPLTFTLPLRYQASFYKSSLKALHAVAHISFFPCHLFVYSLIVTSMLDDRRPLSFQFTDSFTANVTS